MLPSIAMNLQVDQEIRVRRAVQALRGLGVVVVVGAIGFGIWMVVDSRRQAANDKAFAALYEAERMEFQTQKAAVQAAQANAKPEQALPPELEDVVALMAARPEADRKAYFEALEKVAAAHPTTSAGALALLREARTAFASGDRGRAREAYSKVATNGSVPTLYRAMGYAGLGALAEDDKNFAESEKVFEAAVALKDNPIKPLALLGKARAQRAQGRAADAKTTYEKLIQEFPESAYARKARVLMTVSPEG